MRYERDTYPRVPHVSEGALSRPVQGKLLGEVSHLIVLWNILCLAGRNHRGFCGEMW